MSISSGKRGVALRVDTSKKTTFFSEMNRYKSIFSKKITILQQVIIS